MSVTYKDIDQLSQKSSLAGTEKIPVSDTEYITPSQITGPCLPKSGGTMTSGASIVVPDTDADYETEITPGLVSIEDNDDGFSIVIDSFAPYVKVDTGGEYAEYTGYGVVYNDGTSTYTQSFPTKSGTFAMTSDIPSTSGFVSTSGDSMVEDAGLAFSSSGGQSTLVDGGGVYVTNFNNVETDYCGGFITKGQDVLTIPSKTGTIAVTSDIPTIHTGTSDPSSNLGNNGDIYLKLSS